jgi:hypothetical protein
MVFPGAQDVALKELAATLLPESLGRPGTDEVAAGFVRWLNEYHPGAEMQNGYGFTRVRAVPPSATAKYLTQLEELARVILVNPDLGFRRKQLEARLQAADIKDLPALSESADIVVDLMAFYFNSSHANDFAYEAAIDRDGCRGLKSSSQIPSALRAQRARLRTVNEKSDSPALSTERLTPRPSCAPSLDRATE